MSECVFALLLFFALEVVGSTEVVQDNVDLDAGANAKAHDDHDDSRARIKILFIFLAQK